MFSKSLCIVVLVILVAHFVECYPGGAGGCTGGKAAVGGSHLSTTGGKKVLSNTLAKKKITISVGGVSVAAGKTVSVATGKAQTIKVAGTGMEGVMIRVQAPKGVSTTGALAPGKLTKANSYCKSPIVGITQKSSKSQSSYTGTIKFSSPTKGVILDITVVYTNSDKTSEYAYGQVKVDFVKKRL